ncbi:MAG: glycosylphosphatidylinositol anchor biosynthesis [Peltula sp. TS41687]|nr:MAG: glycosylphosphatidylinositol anchor biosynthesis [Peltula sp. TS41687]
MALLYWPWQISSGVRTTAAKLQGGSTTTANEDTRLGRSLLIAAIACILRPTNILIWMSLSFFTLLYANRKERYAFVWKAFCYGSSVVVLSGLLDRAYYGTWTLPLFRFLYYNIVQSLAVFYGRSPWHYYVSQGVPLLLTTALPFLVVGLWNAATLQDSLAGSELVRRVRFQLAIASLFAIIILSFISHKEVRFLYPLLPAFHLFAAEPLTKLLSSEKLIFTKPEVSKVRFGKRVLVTLLLCMNMIIGYYTAVIHQSGVISVMDFLRHQHEDRQSAHNSSTLTTTVDFLMPCHSTPWRSHLVHSGIHAWALGCEPPVDVSAEDREAYVDEADRFYNAPVSFMRDEIGDSEKRYSSEDKERGLTTDAGKSWPEYLVFFAQLEPDLREYFLGAGNVGKNKYKECWRAFNSHWHDDWRRRGDVVVWCLD